jgi:hypothetical protein
MHTHPGQTYQNDRVRSIKVTINPEGHGMAAAMAAVAENKNSGGTAVTVRQRQIAPVRLQSGDND